MPPKKMDLWTFLFSLESTIQKGSGEGGRGGHLGSYGRLVVLRPDKAKIPPWYGYVNLRNVNI